MPLSTSLPAPSIEFVQTWQYPGGTSNPSSLPLAVGSVLLNQLTQRNPVGWTSIPGPVFGGRIDDYGGAGGAPNVRINSFQGRRCIQAGFAGAGFDGRGWRPPDWLPTLSSVGQSPGSYTLEGAVVGVFDWNLVPVLAGATPTWPNDSTGISFLAWNAGTVCNEIPGGGVATTVGGFGVFANNDGAGGTRWEYVSWTTGAPGAVIRRVALPVTTLAAWNTFRTIIISASAGGPATIELQVNGVTAVTDEYGSATLQDPLVAAANPTGLINGVSIGAGPDLLMMQLSAKFGRSTPDGREIQGQ